MKYQVVPLIYAVFQRVWQTLCSTLLGKQWGYWMKCTSVHVASCTEHMATHIHCSAVDLSCSLEFKIKLEPDPQLKLRGPVSQSSGIEMHRFQCVQQYVDISRLLYLSLLTPNRLSYTMQTFGITFSIQHWNYSLIPLSLWRKWAVLWEEGFL